MATIADLGSGTGFLYVTGASGVTASLITTFRNDTTGRERVLSLGSVKSSIDSSTLEYDTVFRLTGNRFFIDTDPAAVEGVVGVTAFEITRYVIGRPSVVPNYYTTTTIAAGVASITRVSNVTLSAMLTEAGAPTDTLDTITFSDTNNGDIVILFSTSGGQVTTVSHGTGNIFLFNGTDFITSTAQNRLTLQYYDQGGGLASGWYEVSRAAVYPSVTNLRAQSVAEPVQGINSAAMPTSGTTTFSPNVDKGYQIVTGSPVLIGAVAYTTGGTPIAGDEFWLDYRATPTIGAFSVTLFGTALTATQAAEGRIVAHTKYDGAAWQMYIFYKNNDKDLVDTVALATREAGLGTPAANGYVLTSTTADIRSWAPNSTFPILHNQTSNNATSAIITEETLKTFSLPASTMDTDSDVVIAKGVYQTEANANGKTVTIRFGATILGTLTGNFNADTIVFEATINRIDATNQSATCSIRCFDTAVPSTLVAESVTYSLPAETLSGAVNITMSGTNAVAAAADIIARQFSVILAQKQ